MEECSKPPTRLITCKSKTLLLGGILNFSSFTKHPNCSVRPGAAATGAMPQRRHAQRRFFTADGRAGGAPGERRLAGTAGRWHLRSKWWIYLKNDVHMYIIYNMYIYIYTYHHHWLIWISNRNMLDMKIWHGQTLILWSELTDRPMVKYS